MKDGSVDLNQNFMDKYFNRKMRMRDTFTVLFPGYEHGNYTNCVPNQIPSHEHYQYPKTNDTGSPTHLIDREFTRKKDYMNDYHENFMRIEKTLRRKRE